jgi:formylglycine-generating enzyme required for sulfatase activity
MRLITFLFLFAILSPLRSAELVESWATLNFQYAPLTAASKSTITVSGGSLIAQLGLSGGGLICVGDAQDRMAAWSFKHRAYAPIAGVAPTETDLSGILKMEVLGYSEVGSAKSPSSTVPKRPLRLGWVTSSRTVKVTFRPSVDCESELWGVMVVNYNVTQYPGSLEASWVPSSVSLKLGGVWTPGDGGQAGSAAMLLTMGSFKKVASDSVQSSVSQLKVAGQSATLKANITGSGSLSYQWFKDGVAVVGGTSSTLIIPSLGLVHAGSYRVEVRDGYGTSQSSFMTLALLEFKQQPQGASVVVGAPITLSAEAQGGDSPVSYQWYKGAQLVAGATGSTLSIGSATLASAGTYSVKASVGGATLMSNSVQVSVRENVALDVTDNFSTGISSLRWTSYQKLSGSMSVVGASGHASFLVSSSSIGSQDAAMVWNARLRTDVDWTAEFRGRNNAPYSANGGSKLGLEIMDARLLNSGTINAEYGDRYLGVKFTRGSEGYREPLFQYWVNDSWQQDISAQTVTEFKFKAVYQAADQTFNFLVETTGAGSDWKLIGTSSLYELVPDATASSELLLLINGKTRYGPISEGQLWVDDFRLIQAAAAMPTSMTVPAGMQLVAEGNFQMGDAQDRDPSAEVHDVFVSGFYILETEVTYASWLVVRNWAEKNGYVFEQEGSGVSADHPVQGIDWYQAVKWCNARSEMEGRKPAYYQASTRNPTQVYRRGRVDLNNDMVDWNSNGYRLPTEAEWEKAARGGEVGKRFPWGNTISHERASYKSETKYAYNLSPYGYHPDYGPEEPRTNPVKNFPKNGFGLYGMVGNVYEWCWDWSSLLGTGQAKDPRGPLVGVAYEADDEFKARRLLRGGGWGSDPGWCRVSSRGNTPDSDFGNAGFRPVLRQ